MKVSMILQITRIIWSVHTCRAETQKRRSENARPYHNMPAGLHNNCIIIRETIIIYNTYSFISQKHNFPSGDSGKKRPPPEEAP